MTVSAVDTPSSPDALLTRDAAAAALTAAGFPIRPPTLATKATRGDGPPYFTFNRKCVYRWGDLLAWANGRLRPVAPAGGAVQPIVRVV